MERGQSSNNKNKGKAPVAEEEDIGDDNNANPSTTIVPSGTDGLGLALVLAPQGTAMEEGSGATSIISRMRREEVAAEGSNPRKRKMHKCKYCEKEFSTSQALGGHQNAHKPERVEAKLQESLGKMGAMERDHINISGRYQPYHFYPTRNIFGGPSLGVPSRGQPPFFQSFHHSFPTAGLGSRFPMPGRIPPPANRDTSGQGFSQRVRTWREFLTRPNNSVPTTSGAGPSNYFGGLSVGSDMGDGRKLNYYPGGIGFGPRSLIGTYNANMNLFGQNFHHITNPIGNMHPNTNPATNANPDINVGANVGVAAAPPANDRSDNEDGGDEGEEELDLTLKL